MTASRSSHRGRPAPLPFLLALFVTAGCLVAGDVTASPFSPGSLDAQVQQCLGDVDADSLFSYIQALQGFQTRHTNSDTTSTTTGVGAARRWVFDKFTEFANQGGNLNASYFDYTTEIFGINRQHRNVVGEIPGTAPLSERRIYVIGGHLDSRNEDAADSVGTAFGADDDASGIACLLELSRVMSTKTWDHTLRFVAFTGEEQGLIGSGFYAEYSRLTEEPIAAMLNNDTMASIIGAPHPDSTVMTDSTLARCFAQDPEEGPDRQFQRYLKAMGDVYVPIQNIVLIPAVDRPSRGGDHESYNAEGFTAIRYMEFLEETWRQHTTDGDTLGTHLDKNYLRRNAQVDLATLGTLALGPASPTGFTVGNIGDSTGFHLQWPSTNTEPDLDGYLITMRTPGALDYETVLDVGMVNSHTVKSPPADSVFFGLSIKDTSDRRALILNEVLGVLSSVPFPPQNVVASPQNSSILVSWTPSPEVDLDGYHVYRSDTSGSGYVQLTGSPIATPFFDDTTAAPHQFHYYVVTAVDLKANESGFSEEAAGQVASLDQGVLLVDETKDGPNTWFPPDALADSVYSEILANVTHDVWDVDDNDIPTISDLAPYSSVFWVSDDFNTTFQGIAVIWQFLELGEDALSDYMDLGGNVFVAGWQNTRGSNRPFDYPIQLGAGDFLYDRFGVEEMSHKQASSLTGGAGQGVFTDFGWEASRLRGSWNGKMIRNEYVTVYGNGAQPAYLFNSDDPDSAYHQQPIALSRDGGGYRSVYCGFPFYHLATADGQSLVNSVLTFFGEVANDVPAGVGGSVRAISLSQNRPNPFVKQTEIRFAVPGHHADIDLTVFDLAGRRVKTLVSERMHGGRHSVLWDGSNDGGRRVASGIYFYRLQSEDRTLTKKLVVLR